MTKAVRKVSLIVGAVAVASLALSGCQVKGSGKFTGIDEWSGTTAYFSTNTKIDVTKGMDPSEWDSKNLKSNGKFKLEGLLGRESVGSKSSRWDIELEFSLKELIEDDRFAPIMSSARAAVAERFSTAGEGPECMGFLGEYEAEGSWFGPTAADDSPLDEGVLFGFVAQGPVVGSTSHKRSVETYLFIAALPYEYFDGGGIPLDAPGFPGFPGFPGDPGDGPYLYWEGVASKANFKFSGPIEGACFL